MDHKIILKGTLDNKNPLYALRGNALVWTDIFGYVEKWYENHIERDKVAYKLLTPRFYPVRKLQFPPPRDININMMPITLTSSSIPQELLHYQDIIRSCWVRRDRVQTMYLTIQEGWVPVGKTQRRPGLHIERPGNNGKGSMIHLGTNEHFVIAWGLGLWDQDIPVDGIYMVSNIANSSRVWPVLINNPDDVCDKHGGIEHMRPYLGEGRNLEAGELCWITDRTPHESLPVEAPADDPKAEFVYRQFFRLVAGPISVWYAQHNTPNPLGIPPECPISIDNKFLD
jgi:hypothetical protein